MDQLIFASLSHTHFWYEVGMLRVPAYGGLNKEIDTDAEIGRNPLSKHQIQPGENEQADARRDGRTRLARPNFQARTGTGN